MRPLLTSSSIYDTNLTGTSKILYLFLEVISSIPKTMSNLDDRFALITSVQQYVRPYEQDIRHWMPGETTWSISESITKTWEMVCFSTH